ncbi:MAG: CRISPR-associated endonuclease Cas1 [Lentisphaeria bacterium]|nr:CRISPR-associated endonuclease Cas1 [Lentisphaeria bacterium]
MPTLYLNGRDTEARVESKRVVVTRYDEEAQKIMTMRVPFFEIDRVVVIGQAACTMPLLHRLARKQIPIHLLTGSAKWLGTFYPNANGHALRRLKQYELARDGHFSLRNAREVVAAKLRNSRRVLQRMAANRDESKTQEQLAVCNSLQMLILKALEADTPDCLRGYEGHGAAIYFRRLGDFFPEETPFKGRNRRPPKDEANALLSWTYTIVLTEIDAAVRSAGLDPCLGFFHEVSYGRPSLALDLLEPLRPALCDMLVLRLLNHRLLRKDDHFEFRAEEGGVFLNEVGRRSFFPEYERTMLRRFSASKGGQHTDFRKVIREQVNAFMRVMEKRADPEFFIMP